MSHPVPHQSTLVYCAHSISGQLARPDCDAAIAICALRCAAAA